MENGRINFFHSIHRITLVEEVFGLAPDRRQQGRQILPVGAIRRQNRMRRQPGCRRRHVLQEGGQSAGRAEVDVSASAIFLQPLYGFTESNLRRTTFQK